MSLFADVYVSSGRCRRGSLSGHFYFWHFWPSVTFLSDGSLQVNQHDLRAPRGNSFLIYSHALSLARHLATAEAFMDQRFLVRRTSKIKGCYLGAAASNAPSSLFCMTLFQQRRCFLRVNPFQTAL